MSSLVIIGSGLAGYTVAREFRKLDETTPITIITRDNGAFYSKPMLSNALAKGKDASTLITSSADQMRASLNATIMTETEVTLIEPQHHLLKTSSGDVVYAALVIACGAVPFRPPIEGDAADEVLSINNLGDYARFREQLDGAQRVAIIGPGLIGCEFANDMMSVGKQITVIGPDPYPLSTLLPEAVGSAMQQALAQQGIVWQLGTSVSAVNRDGSNYRIALQNGTELTVDLVVSAIGLRPNIALAAAAGIETNRGIVTNRRLETSLENIYAVGDCAEVAGLNLLFVAPLMAQARALAKTLSGTPTEVTYPAMPVVIKTPLFPLVVSPPARGADGDWTVDGEVSGLMARFYAPDGSLLGFALSGEAITEKQALTKELPAVLS